ncbi:MAG: ATP-binding protein [Elusimicrobia bacterium]|nr:ATP-binding protein [Elusimicrobiota bacterium]
MGEGMENIPDKTIYSEMDYLWQSVRDAQESASSAIEDRKKTAQEASALSSRLAHLERALKECLERETGLKTEISALQGKIEGDADIVARARKLNESAGNAPGREAALAEELAGKKGENSILEAEIAALRSELAGLKETLAARQRAVDALQGKAAALTSLGEIAEIIKADCLASGKTASAYEILAARLGEAVAARKRALHQTSAFKAVLGKTAEKIVNLEKNNSALRRGIAEQEEAAAALRAQLELKENRLALSAGEKIELENRLAAVLASRSGLEERLKDAENRCAEYKETARKAEALSSELEFELAGTRLKAEEQKSNFTGAVKQIFGLQEKAAELRRGLEESSQKTRAVQAALEARNSDIEKINLILRDRSADLFQEKEIHKKALVKIRILQENTETLNERLVKNQEYAAALMRRLEEKERTLTDLKEENKRVGALEREIDDLKRKNLHITELIKREQFNFTDKVSASLEKASKGIKGFSIRLSVPERRGFEPSLKSLADAVEIIKGWREYMDEETPELSEENLAHFLSDQAAHWETTFRTKRLALSKQILMPYATARINAQKLKLAFTNIITNAYEHLGAGGALKLVLKASENEAEAVFAFEDSGPGFSQEALEKLFLPFNPGGKDKVGIGLTIAEAVARKHGGKLTAKNGKMRGALVELTLPIARELPK